MAAAVPRSRLEGPSQTFTRVVTRSGGGTSCDRRHRDDVTRISCTIVVAGELGDRFDGVFGDLFLVPGAGTTELSGTVADQSALQGVLRQVADLGLDIVSVSTQME